MRKCMVALFLLVAMTVWALEENQCKDMLQGYLTGQLTSALGTLQVEALRKEMKIQIENIEASCLMAISEMRSETSKGTKGPYSTWYIRWGRKTCPKDATLVYTGYAAGGHYNHSGSGPDTICLPSDPEWDRYSDVTDAHRGYVYGTEYEFYNIPDSGLRRLHEHDVPCSFCKVSGRTATAMIPGRKTCYKGWNKEYSGYLVSSHFAHRGHSGYKCVDESPEPLHGGHANRNGNLFYPVESMCGSLKCPPYVEGRELTCVVCSI